VVRLGLSDQPCAYGNSTSRLAVESFASGKLHVTECFRLLAGAAVLLGHGQQLLTLQLDKIIVVSLMSAKAAGFILSP